MRGIYPLGEIFGLQLPLKNGVRPKPITLETSDGAEAIKRANKTRDNPVLSTSARLFEEITTAADYNMRMREWSEASVASKKSVLLAMNFKCGEERSIPMTRAFVQFMGRYPR